MLAVTAYPIINALWLSLYNYRLTDPSARSFVFLRNYVVILTDSLWWAAVGVTVIITLVTVAVEFVLGMALAMVMNKIVHPPAVAADGHPDPLRDHHRRVGVLLEVRVRRRLRLRQPLAAH